MNIFFNLYKITFLDILKSDYLKEFKIKLKFSDLFCSKM